MLGASIPIAAATAALMATPAAAAPVLEYVGIDRGAGGWTAITWMARIGDKLAVDRWSRVWVRPCPAYVRMFSRHGLIGVEGSADNLKYYELFSHDASGRFYVGTPQYVASHPIALDVDDFGWVDVDAKLGELSGDRTRYGLTELELYADRGRRRRLNPPISF